MAVIEGVSLSVGVIGKAQERGRVFFISKTKINLEGDGRGRVCPFCQFGAFLPTKHVSITNIYKVPMANASQTSFVKKIKLLTREFPCLATIGYLFYRQSRHQ